MPTARFRGVLRGRTRAASWIEDGQALVEFALILPVLLVLLFGIIQFGLAVNSANDQTHLANEVARYAVVNEDPGSGTLQEWGKSQAESNLLSNGAKVCIAFPNGTEIGNPVKVEVRSTINWLPVLGLNVTETEMIGTAFMRLEAAPSKYAAGCSS
jgi:Flp pilus assembly protein TadG